MLKNIDPLLNADVLYALAAMGHGPKENLIIAVFVFYLVGTAWLTVARPERTAGLAEKIAFVVALGLCAPFGFIAWRLGFGPGATFVIEPDPDDGGLGGRHDLVNSNPARLQDRRRLVADGLWRCWARFDRTAGFLFRAKWGRDAKTAAGDRGEADRGGFDSGFRRLSRV